jgi:hypothetical protein
LKGNNAKKFIFAAKQNIQRESEWLLLKRKEKIEEKRSEKKLKK